MCELISPASHTLLFRHRRGREAPRGPALPAERHHHRGGGGANLPITIGNNRRVPVVAVPFPGQRRQPGAALQCGACTFSAGCAALQQPPSKTHS